MSTATLPQVRRPQTNRTADRIFFPFLTLAILVTVFLGFSRTYYSAGMVLAPLPNILIHIHALVYTAWLVMLVVQTGLVSAKRTDLHRKLGLWGFGIACCMLVMGLLAATDMLRRNAAPPGLPALTFYVIPFTDVLIFSGFMYFAYRWRTQPATHKRLIMIGTIAILDAAIARMPYGFIRGASHWHADMVCYCFLLVMMIYDALSTDRVHKATIWGSLTLIVLQQVRIPLAMTPAWQHFAHVMQGLGI